MYIVGKLSLGNISIGMLNKANTENINKPIITTITAIGRVKAVERRFFNVLLLSFN